MTNNKLYNCKKKNLPTRAGGIIFDKETKHILLVLNRDSFNKRENKWGLPKGHLSSYEKIYPHIGAQREILEETGIYFPLTEDTFSILIYDTKYFVTNLCKKNNFYFTPKDKTEIIHACWFPVHAISKLNVNRTLSRLICKWKNIFSDIDCQSTDWILEGDILKNIKESRIIDISCEDDTQSKHSNESNDSFESEQSY